jgi:8-oxo-dGTP diphosphatase
VPTANLTRMNGAATDPRAAIARTVRDLDPLDEVERDHQAAVRDWIDSGAELYRVDPPGVPPMHLVSYFVPFDRETNSILVTAHRKSGLDLPPGGHCEPGEMPWQTVERECVEELGVGAVPAKPIGPRPLFLTVTDTRGAVGRHTDVSLWYVLDLAATDPRLRPDPREFAAVRWLSLDAVLTEPITRFDPHMHRFAHKLRAALARPLSRRPY